MGSPLVPTFADIFMGHLEEKVDGVFAIVKDIKEAEELLSIMNKLHPMIRLKMEKEEDAELTSGPGDNSDVGSAIAAAATSAIFIGFVASEHIQPVGSTLLEVEESAATGAAAMIVAHEEWQSQQQQQQQQQHHGRGQKSEDDWAAMPSTCMPGGNAIASTGSEPGVRELLAHTRLRGPWFADTDTTTTTTIIITTTTATTTTITGTTTTTGTTTGTTTTITLDFRQDVRTAFTRVLLYPS
ncbi:hypothetical protein SprV_1002811500 [Sparganum proliferum]